MKVIIILSFLLSVAGCYKVDADVKKSPIVPKPTTFRWKTTTQALNFSQDFPESFQTYTSDMASKWNAPFPQNTLINTKSSPASNYEEQFTTIEAVSTDGHNVIYLVNKDEWPTENSLALGITILMGRSNDEGQFIISEADILILNQEDKHDYDYQTIIIHELGHFLGLQHQNLGEASRHLSVMYPSIKENEIKRAPTELDKSTLGSLYKLPYGVIGKKPAHSEVSEGKGELKRIIFELGADMKCRHLIDGVLVHTHNVLE